MNEIRILIVDDDHSLLEALPEAIRLRMNGLEIDTCDSAASALERLREVDYDAIVTDIKMPGMDGLALLEAIQETRPRTPTLLITGHGEQDLAVQALRGGAYDYIAKPIDRDYFVASLKRAIQLKSLDRQIDKQRVALERHARVLEHVDDGVFLLDEKGLIQHWNRPPRRSPASVPSDVLDRPAEEAIPGWDVDGPDRPDRNRGGPGKHRGEDPADRDRRPRALDLDLRGGIRRRHRLRVPKPDRGARARRAEGRVRGDGLARAANAARPRSTDRRRRCSGATSSSTRRAKSGCSR